jgi:hypothetical protein
VLPASEFSPVTGTEITLYERPARIVYQSKSFRIYGMTDKEGAQSYVVYQDHPVTGCSRFGHFNARPDAPGTIEVALRALVGVASAAARAG